MDFTLLYNPIITPGAVATITSVATLVIVIKHMATIGKALNQLGAKVWTRAGFFWTVNIVFMAVSILHGGIFFGIAGDGHDVPGVAQYLGFAVSFFLDLVTIILMQAMLEARYRGEEGRAQQFLLFIAICCGTSTFANLAISLNDFDATVMLPHAPWAIQVASPYVLASFPLFVIMMSIAAEMIVNVRPLESLNEEEYEADEKKRLKILEIRNTYLQKQADEELRTLTIRAQMNAHKLLRKGDNTLRFPWSKSSNSETIIAEVSTQLKAMYEPQIESLKKQLEGANTADFSERDDYDESASQEALLMETEDSTEDSGLAPIDFENARASHQYYEQETAGEIASPVAKREDKDVAKKVRRLVLKYPQMSSTEIAQKADCSRSYAGKLKAQILKTNDPQNEGA